MKEQEMEEMQGTSLDAAARAQASAKMEEAALAAKRSIELIHGAIIFAPAEILQDLADANLNSHHALGRLNSARAMLRRGVVDA